MKSEKRYTSSRGANNLKTREPDRNRMRVRSEKFQQEMEAKRLSGDHNIHITQQLLNTDAGLERIVTRQAKDEEGRPIVESKTFKLRGRPK